MDKYISKINELYITTRDKYLIMLPNGIYITAGKYSNTRIKKPLVNSDIQSHLEGNKTFGVFAGDQLSKFICFDIDVPDTITAKWHAYKVIHALIEIGIPENKIYPSLSGSKGYHIEVFFNGVVPNVNIQYLFNITLEVAGYEKCEEFAYSCEGGKIELRPVGKNLGVKIPLGKHFKTKGKKRCWFVDSDTLKEIRKKSFILDIEQVDKDILDNILERQIDLTVDESFEDVNFHNEAEKLKVTIEDHYKHLDIYSHNIDESSTYEAIKKLEKQGLKSVGTRHNSLFKLAKLYRYEGLNQDQCFSTLVNWMDNQDKSTYTTSWKECLKDIEQIVDYIYKNGVNLTIQNKQIVIYEKELLKLLSLPKRSQKLVAFAFLVHSKRFAQANGVFYMTLEQLKEATGYSTKTVSRELEMLEQNGIITIVARNQLKVNERGQFVGKLPNKYKVNIIFEDNGEVDVKRTTINLADHKEYHVSYKDSLLNLFDLPALKKMLPKRNYDELRRYKQVSCIA